MKISCLIKRWQERSHFYTADLRKVILFLKEKYTQEVKLKEISELVGIDPSYLCRKFKKHFNCTIFEYLIYCRVLKAAELLLKTEKNIAQIGYEVGYSSIPTFSRTFKEWTGHAPVHFRQKYLALFNEKENEEEWKEILFASLA